MAMLMRHAIGVQSDPDDAPGVVRYEWRRRSEWSGLTVESSGRATPLVPGSESEFITEHFWGYTRQRDGGTVEYRVAHPSWRTWRVDAASVRGDLSELYGMELGRVLARAPHSVFLAQGSAIEVHMPVRLER